MSAKPKCPKCGKSTLKVFGAIVRCGLSDGIRIVNGCGWSKSVSRAAIIRLAVHPKADYSRGYAAGHDALIRPESILPLQAAKDWRERAEELQDTLGLAQLAAQTWKHRAEAAEAERDSLRRQLAQEVKAR